jgi:hypothetical protein
MALGSRQRFRRGLPPLQNRCKTCRRLFGAKSRLNAQNPSMSAMASLEKSRNSLQTGGWRRASFHASLWPESGLADLVTSRIPQQRKNVVACHLYSNHDWPLRGLPLSGNNSYVRSSGSGWCCSGYGWLVCWRRGFQRGAPCRLILEYCCARSEPPPSIRSYRSSASAGSSEVNSLRRSGGPSRRRLRCCCPTWRLNPTWR